MRFRSVWDPVRRLSCVSLLGAWALFAWETPAAAEPESELRIGWDGHVVLGDWTPVVRDLSVETLGDGAHFRLDVTATDPDGNLATFTGDETPLDERRLRVTGRFQLGRPDGHVLIRLYRDGVLWREEGPFFANGSKGPFRQIHPHAERLLITAGLPEKVQALFEPAAPGQRTVIHYPDAAALPTDLPSYDSVVGLLLSGPKLPSEDQVAALSRWVQGGGRLYVSIGLSPGEFRDTALAKSLPVAIDPEPVPTRELTALE